MAKSTGMNETKPVKKITAAPRRRTGRNGTVKNATGATAHTAPERTNATAYPVPQRKNPTMGTMKATDGFSTLLGYTNGGNRGSYAGRGK